MTSPAFERLPSCSLRGRIAETPRDAILNGTLEEGQRLVERNLAAQLGASLTAVHEALIELEMEGFIQKKGARNLLPLSRARQVLPRRFFAGGPQ